MRQATCGLQVRAAAVVGDADTPRRDAQVLDDFLAAELRDGQVVAALTQGARHVLLEVDDPVGELEVPRGDVVLRLTTERGTETLHGTGYIFRLTPSIERCAG